MIEAEFYELLSGLVSGRMYPNSIPQKTRGNTDATRPLIVYHTESMEPDYAMSGVTAPLKSQMEFECQATTYLAAKTLATAVFDAVKNLGQTSLNDTEIQSCFASIDSDEFTPGVSGQETGFHSVIVMVDVTYV